jgi:hypothetical protein
MPVTLATQEAEMRISFELAWVNSLGDPILKIPTQKRAG